MSKTKQVIAWATLLASLYLLYAIWQEIRREGNETIVVVDSYREYESDWPPAWPMPNGRGKQADDPLLN